MRRIIDRVVALKVTAERGDACGLVRDHVIDRRGLTIEDHPSRRPKAEEVGRDVHAVCAEQPGPEGGSERDNICNAKAERREHQTARPAARFTSRGGLQTCQHADHTRRDL